MKSVIVIDDDEAIGFAIKRVLERAGHRVLAATDVPTGLEALRARGADVVVTDMLMPTVNGAEAIRAISSEFPWVRIVAISGGGQAGGAAPGPGALSTTAYLAAARAAGAHATLTKPFETHELLRALGNSVLIVDDEPAIRHALTRVLVNAGYAVRAASNGSDALEDLRAERADIVITDIIMPHLNGVETIRQIARDYPHMRIVAISGGGGYGTSAYRSDAITTTAYLSAAQAAGAHAVLTKPFELRDVLVAIGHAAAAD